MFAGARIGIAPAVAAALVVGLSACDLSQKKPETGHVELVTQHVGESPAARSGAVEAQSEQPGYERSIRLYGPGVSRQRQTRI